MMRGVLLALGAMALAGGPLPADAAPEGAPTMAKAATSFLATLDPASRAKARLPFNSAERLNWNAGTRDADPKAAKANPPALAQWPGRRRAERP